MKYPEKLLVRMAEGTKARLQAAIGDDDAMTPVIRDLIEAELRRRERLARKAAKTS